MEKLLLKTKNYESTIYTGENIAAPLIKKITSGRQCFALIDSNVDRLYGEMFKGFADSFFVFKAGEGSKNFKTLEKVLSQMVKANLRRIALLLAIGGGVAGDMGGLAASLYMRGIEAVQVPTTLLSQVDSSIGGKTAVNFGGIKNSIGAFYQPKTVICDSAFLNTLNKRQIKCGLGEIIKTAALDKEIFNLIWAVKDNLFFPGVYKSLILPCVKFKANIVKIDERESGLRKILNLGHTTAHALEITYKRKSHGEFVLEGMLIELYISKKLGLCDAAYAGELKALILTVIKGLPKYENIENALIAALTDKKNTAADKVSLILPVSRGEVLEKQLSFDDYVRLVKESIYAD